MIVKCGNTKLWITLRKIRNNFFVAVGLGNCMGFGLLFNKIISDLRTGGYDYPPKSIKYFELIAQCRRHHLLRLLDAQIIASSLAPPWLLFPENVGYNPPLSGSPKCQVGNVIFYTFRKRSGNVPFHRPRCTRGR